MRQKIKAFISNDREYPVLAGFMVGFYVLAFYYSNNFDLANSWQQLLFLIGYFVVAPIVACWLVYKIVSISRFKKYARQALFITMLSILTFFIIQNFAVIHFSRKLVFIGIIGLIVLLSFKFRNYKVAILLLLFMSVFPTFEVSKKIVGNIITTGDWTKQPDAILAAKFKKTPNVYYFQLDGYANHETLKSKLYQYDNSHFDSITRANGFKVYESFRSNYSSTLKSNASCFNMKHHLSNENSQFKNARDYIMDENAALQVFKNNGYKAFFISERPYLQMNRPKVKFDYSNFSNSDLPYLKDGWAMYMHIEDVIKKQILENKGQRNFFFIEKFDPGHISVYKEDSKGVAEERKTYLQKLETANAWMLDLANFISEHDKDAIVIIGADHGGFVGFDYTLQSFGKITDKDLLQSIFGAHLAIKWNDPNAGKFDANLKTSVNLFRTLFSYLSDNPEYLKHYQPDVSYNSLEFQNHKKVYKAIE